MRKRGTLFLGGGLLAAALAFAPGIAGLGTAAWAAPAPTAGLTYVALGDSYAVGLGLPNPIGTVPGCGQSTSSYPRQLAAALELTLIDVTCSGAKTVNITTTAQATGDGTNPVQATALTDDTDIVTLTIGGNDLGFTSIIQTCLAESATGPLLFNPMVPKPANCKSLYAPDGGSDSLAELISGTVSEALAATLTTVKDAAPNAKIFVVAYPALMPGDDYIPPAGCFTSFTGISPAFPFTTVDVNYLHVIQTKLDAAMSAAAGTAGATFVPMLSSTLDNSPCANNPDTYVNGASGLPGAMHPNAAGAAFMTTTTKDAIEASLSAPAITPAATNFNIPVDVSASLSFTATGFPAPGLSISGDLPDDMAFDTATGVLSGTPSNPGATNFSLTATNSVGSVTERYTVSVTEVPVITSGAPPSPGTVGTPYSFTVTATGFPAPTLAINGPLPDGLIFAPGTGEISGTPTYAGTFGFTVTAANTAGSVTSDAYSIEVEPAGVAPKITSSTPPAATLGNKYSFTVAATGYPAPTFAITAGALPKGLALDAVSGAITGTPTEAGNFSFTVTAQNATAPAATAQYNIKVTNPSAGGPTGLVTTGSGSLISMGVAGSIVLLSGAGLLVTRRFAKR